MELRWLVVLVVVLSLAYAGKKRERGVEGETQREAEMNQKTVSVSLKSTVK